MAEDVKVLREAAEEYREYGEKFGLRVPLAIVFRVVADMIEREEKPQHGTFREPKNAEVFIYPVETAPTPTPDALQAAEDRGWNAAIEAAIAKLDLGDALSPQGQALAEVFLKTLRALRREPRT